MATVSGTNSGAYKGTLVRVYHRETGNFVGETTSSASTGVWSVTTTYSGKHFAVCHDSTHSDFSKNKIAIPFLGANGSTSFPDYGGATVSIGSGSPAITTSQTDPFGGSGGVLSLSGWMTLTNIPTNYIGVGDWHIRVWLYPTSFPDGAEIFFGVNNTVTFRKEGTKKLGLVHEAVVWHGYASSDPTLNTWTCVQARRSGNSLNIYYGSTSVFSGSYTTNYTPSSTINALSGITGYACDLEVLNYAASPTPPTARLSPLSSATENALIYDDITPV